MRTLGIQGRETARGAGRHEMNMVRSVAMRWPDTSGFYVFGSHTWRNTSCSLQNSRAQSHTQSPFSSSARLRYTRDLYEFGLTVHFPRRADGRDWNSQNDHS